MNAIQEKSPSIDWIQFLPILALCVDFFTPYLIGQNYIPAQVRWASHVVIVLMIGIVFFRMLVFDRIPRAAWLIPALLLLWSYIATGHGQKLSATLWGIWLLFQFPLVCLFIYLQPNLWQGLPTIVRKYGLILLGIQVGAQLLQYTSGAAPGDNLSGLFGKSGTSKMVIFVLFMSCVYFGHWVASREWKGLLIALPLGVISTVLGETKVYPAAIGLIGLLAIFLYSVKYRTPGILLTYSLLILVTLFGYVSLYNTIIPKAQENPLQTFITDPNRIAEYNSQSHRSYSNGQWITYTGRDATLEMGWKSLQEDPITFLFGYGIGSRSESTTLGTVGVAQNVGGQGLSTNTSLSVMMQELGLVGLMLLASFLLWITLTLIRDIREHPESPAVGLRYGLLLFSLLWPLWLYYSNIWTMMRVPMLLYWMLLGYVLAEPRRPMDQIWLRVSKEVGNYA